MIYIVSYFALGNAALLFILERPHHWFPKGISTVKEVSPTLLSGYIISTGDISLSVLMSISLQIQLNVRKEWSAIEALLERDAVQSVFSHPGFLCS